MNYCEISKPHYFEAPCVIHNLTPGIMLNITKLKSGVCILTTTDLSGDEIKIPNGLILYECGSPDDCYKIVLNKTNDYVFQFHSIYNYKVEYNRII